RVVPVGRSRPLCHPFASRRVGGAPPPRTLLSPMSPPQFSVVIPTYNRADILPIAVDSVLAQTCSDFELVIADDGSTDDTRALVAGCGDPRVRYVWQERGGV